ncbi:MAG: thioether cross-link-forming SCIFF peptide maturase [Oscillospiraceae bacterium]|nr:thioether cross-link-forming SCIFF peptide maturase [Oscillospiraceae bacterium]
MSCIHKFQQGDDYFIIDPVSGAVHVADKLAYDALDTFNLNGELTSPLHSEIYELYKAGLLFSKDDCHAYADLPPETPLKALCLHVSHDCNLRCEYCFAETGGYGMKRGIMSPETAIKAIDFLFENSGERVDLEADFFGGEPLMAWETVKAAVDYARRNEQSRNKKVRFTITTNGLLLDDEKIEYINREMVNCVLSLDGRREVNDRIRGKSFDKIVPRFQKLVETRTNPGFTDCYVRGTFTAYNLDFTEDVIAMSELGFRNISIEPVTAYSNEPYAITHKHLPRIFEEYDRLYELIRSGESGVNFFHFMIDLTGGPCIIRRLRGCGSGNEYVAVTPEGDVYPCHRFVGHENFKMGNIHNNCQLSTVHCQLFAGTHIYSKSDCPDCWARFYCSGGCNASSYECFGDVKKTDSNSVECLMMKKRLECAIALNALKQEDFSV